MNSLSEFTNELLALNASIIALSPNADTSFSNIDKFLDEVIAKMRIADDEVLKLVDDFALLSSYNENLDFRSNYRPNIKKWNSEEYDENDIVTYSSVSQVPDIENSTYKSGLVHGMKTVTELANDLGEVYEYAGGTMPVKLSKVIKGAKGIASVAKGIAEVSEGLEENGIISKNMAENIQTATKFAGVASLAAELTLFGPGGWIAAVALMTGAVAYDYYEKDRAYTGLVKKQRDIQEERAMQSFVMDTEEEGRKYVISKHEIKPRPPLKKLHIEDNFLATVYKKHGSDAFARNPNPPLAVVDNVRNNTYPHPQEKGYQPKPNFGQQTFNLYYRLLAVGQKGGIDSLNDEIAKERLKIKTGKGKLSADDAEIMFTHVKAELFNEANKERYAQPNVKHRSVKRQTGYETNHSDGKTIIINLNKAMIEHFTVNAKEIKEGVNEFKHKVEEVLLEILNSVNTH